MRPIYTMRGYQIKTRRSRDGSATLEIKSGKLGTGQVLFSWKYRQGLQADLDALDRALEYANGVLWDQGYRRFCTNPNTGDPIRWSMPRFKVYSRTAPSKSVGALGSFLVQRGETPRTAFNRYKAELELSEPDYWTSAKLDVLFYQQTHND